MTEQLARVDVSIAPDSDTDREELALLTTQLRDWLRQLSINSAIVTPIGDPWR